MSRLMVSVETAFEILTKTINQLGSCILPTEGALGHVLYEDIISPINMPPFNQSAMDGYAICLGTEDTYRVIGEVKAGDRSVFILNAGEAVRIYTGAMVPSGANVVAKQEIVIRTNNTIYIQEQIHEGENIRPIGEQIEKGQLAIPKNTVINSGAVGYIAMLGLTEVCVFRKPTITIIATGNELTPPGKPLETGSVYESNTYALKATLKASGFGAKIQTVQDDFDETKKSIKTAINENDVVIITGGISVGDYDYVKEALFELGVITDFYKVKQKPGKPLFFGHKDDKLIFALPGNPAAVLTCCHVYVLPTLRFISGNVFSFNETSEYTLANSYSKTSLLTHFLKGYISKNEVEILSSQSSAMLNSFVRANCLVKMDEGQENWTIGDKVKVIRIPV